MLRFAIGSPPEMTLHLPYHQSDALQSHPRFPFLSPTLATPSAPKTVDSPAHLRNRGSLEGRCKYQI